MRANIAMVDSSSFPIIYLVLFLLFNFTLLILFTGRFPHFIFPILKLFPALPFLFPRQQSKCINRSLLEATIIFAESIWNPTIL